MRNRGGMEGEAAHSGRDSCDPRQKGQGSRSTRHVRGMLVLLACATCALHARRCSHSPSHLSPFVVRFLVDAHGHLMAKYRKPGRAAFPMVEEVGSASWAFKKMGFV